MSSIRAAVPAGQTQAGEQAYARRWWALGVLSLCVLLVNMNTTMLNVALPTIVRDLGATATAVQWMPASFTLTVAGLMLLAGSLGDRWGRKRMLLAGLSLFGVASIAGAWASSAWMLIGAEVVMGIGASVIMPLTLGMVRTMFAPAEQGRAVALWSTTVAFGLPLGPILGGLMVNNFWWGSIFVVNVVTTLIVIPLGLLLLPEFRAPKPGPIDLVGGLLSIAGVGSLVYGFIKAGESWTSLETLGSIGLGVVILAAFAGYERKIAAAPIVNLALFRMAAFTRPLIVMLMVMFAMLSLMFVAPQYLQSVGGHNAMETGLRLVPIGLASLVGSFIGPRMTDRFGAHWSTAFGLLSMAGGLGLLTFIDPTTGDLLFAAGLSLLGLGIGTAQPAAMTAAMSTLPRESAGSGAGLLNAVRSLGGVFGVAIVGSAISAAYRDRLGSLGDIPATLVEPVRDSVVKAAAAANSIGGPAADHLRDAAFTAYTGGMSVVLTVCAAVALVSAVLALFFMPRPKPRS